MYPNESADRKISLIKNLILKLVYVHVNTNKAPALSTLQTIESLFLAYNFVTNTQILVDQ